MLALHPGLPDGGHRRSRTGGCQALRELPDHRVPRNCSARAAPLAGGLGLRVRRLPGTVPVELLGRSSPPGRRRGPGDPGAGREALSPACRPGCVDSGSLRPPVQGQPDQAGQASGTGAQCGDRTGKFRGSGGHRAPASGAEARQRSGPPACGMGVGPARRSDRPPQRSRGRDGPGGPGRDRPGSRRRRVRSPGSSAGRRGDSYRPAPRADGPGTPAGRPTADRRTGSRSGPGDPWD